MIETGISETILIGSLVSVPTSNVVDDAERPCYDSQISFVSLSKMLVTLAQILRCPLLVLTEFFDRMTDVDIWHPAESLSAPLR